MQTINGELGTTILFVEQNLGMIRGMADRGCAMERGTIGDELDGQALSDEERMADFLAV